MITNNELSYGVAVPLAAHDVGIVLESRNAYLLLVANCIGDSSPVYARQRKEEVFIHPLVLPLLVQMCRQDSQTPTI